MRETDFILVSAPTKAGEQFIHQLQQKNIPLAATAGTEEEKENLAKLGVDHIILLDRADTELIPEFPIGNVYLFDDYLPLCCRYLQFTRNWTSKTVYVITDEDNGWSVYKRFGADYVIHSKTGNVNFLIN